MRIAKRRKVSRQRLEAHYVSSTRPAYPAAAPFGHWVIRPLNSRTTARIWRFG